MADFGGTCRFGNADRRGDGGQASPGSDGTTDGLVIQAGMTRPSRLARPTTALRV